MRAKVREKNKLRQGYVPTVFCWDKLQGAPKGETGPVLLWVLSVGVAKAWGPQLLLEQKRESADACSVSLYVW